MKIKVLGTKGEIEASAPYHSHQSGVLLDDLILLDCGDKTFLKNNPKYIFITHLHPDHAYFAREPDKKYDINNDIKIFSPENFEGDVATTVFNDTKKVDGYEITAIPTIHSIKVESQAYLIQKNDQKILYTGDMIWIKKDYHHLLKDLNLVITEASFMRKGGMVRRQEETDKIYGHTGVPDLINLFSRFTKNILFMHFGTWFFEDIEESREKMEQLAEENHINIHVGYDGLNMDVSELEE